MTHIRERGAFIEQCHPVAGKTRVYRTPWASALTAIESPAPCLGEHNDYVFKELLNMSDEERLPIDCQKVIY